MVRNVTVEQPAADLGFFCLWRQLINRQKKNKWRHEIVEQKHE